MRPSSSPSLAAHEGRVGARPSAKKSALDKAVETKTSNIEDFKHLTLCTLKLGVCVRSLQCQMPYSLVE